MTAEFEAFFRTQVNLSDSEMEQVHASAIQRTLQRNELLLQQGQVCRHKVFVVKGLLRNFAVAADGNEHILQFSAANNWTLDVESYDRETPAVFNIAAIEKSEVLLWTKPDFNRLLNDIPKLKSFSERLISHNMHLSRQRILAGLSASPEEKYEDFVSSSPDLLLRLPLRMIAAYLGISLKTLTRIRHAQLHR